MIEFVMLFFSSSSSKLSISIFRYQSLRSLARSDGWSVDRTYVDIHYNFRKSSFATIVPADQVGDGGDEP